MANHPSSLPAYLAHAPRLLASLEEPGMGRYWESLLEDATMGDIARAMCLARVALAAGRSPAELARNALADPNPLIRRAVS